MLATIDYILIFSFFIISLFIGIYLSKKSGKDASEFFLSGRRMPWWLLGVSMVATTFSADTPNLVAGIVRSDGVKGNWVWWSFLLTGMLTVFFYARLWRRTGVTTDLEFYELRYKGKSAAFLRGFRAIYLGVVFNIFIMATVCLAAIKIGGTMFGFSAGESLLIACSVTLFYSVLGGFKSVLITDFIQFFIAMVGSIWATVHIINLPEIDGMQNLISHPNVVDKISFLPDFNDPKTLIPIFIIPIAVQWWSVWYPGAEPGGGGYVAQRMLAAKDEKHATWATLFFNFAHYALRPWPWIIIGLASLIMFPDLKSLGAAFPNLDPAFIKHDLSYPAMLTYLPAGLLGLVVTSLVAAFMSTISTHLNWGSSYVVNDFYARFINKDASEKKKVAVGRLATLIMMIIAALLSLVLEEAKEAFDLLLQIGAGTGLLFILRWFWKRINPYSEIAAMVISFLVALVFFVNNKLETPLFKLETYEQLILGILITTLGWIVVTLLTKPTDAKTLATFEEMVFGKESKFHNIGFKIAAFFLGTIGVYSFLFATGYIIYGELTTGVALAVITVLCSIVLVKLWPKLR